jgi:hypothetical protein
MEDEKRKSLLAAVRSEVSESLRLYFQPVAAVVSSVSSALRVPMADSGERDVHASKSGLAVDTTSLLFGGNVGNYSDPGNVGCPFATNELGGGGIGFNTLCTGALGATIGLPLSGLATNTGVFGIAVGSPTVALSASLLGCSWNAPAEQSEVVRLRQLVVQKDRQIFVLQCELDALRLAVAEKDISASGPSAIFRRPQSQVAMPKAA